MPTTPPAIGHPRWRQPAIDEEGSRSGRGRGGKSGLSRSFCVAAPMERGQCAYWHLLITWPLGGKPAHRDGWPCWRGRALQPMEQAELASSVFPAGGRVSEPGGEAWSGGLLGGTPQGLPSRLSEALPLLVPLCESPQRSLIQILGGFRASRELLSAPLCPLCPLDVGESWRGEAYGEPE